jgi:hypothetical protein
VLFNLVKHSLLFSSETSVTSLTELVHLVCECYIFFKGVLIFRLYNQVSGNFTNLIYNKVSLLSNLKGSLVNVFLSFVY